MGGKGKKKLGGARLWMKFDRFGNSELMEFDKSTIIKRVAIPSRDLRILSSFSSHSSHILAREKAMVVHLEFIRAIVTADEVLILDPLRQEVLPFVDQLIIMKQLLVYDKSSSPSNIQEAEMQSDNKTTPFPVPETVEDSENELPFEFQILEIVLELICTHFDSCVEKLEKDAYSSLDELVKNVNNDSLQHVLSLKSNLTRLLARIQKVRNEIEHLLNDHEDMANLHLTRKLIHNDQQFEGWMGATAHLNSITTIGPHLHRFGSTKSASVWWADHHHLEDLEMLLEAYFVQLEGMRNKLLSVREYINDTEDYVNIQLDNKRNELIQIQLMLKASAVPIAFEFAICGAFSMNIPCVLYNMHGIFGYVVLGVVTSGFLFFMSILGYFKYKNLLGS